MAQSGTSPDKTDDPTETQTPAPDAIANQLSQTSINNNAPPEAQERQSGSLQKLEPARALDSLVAASNTKSMSEYKFWSTQPVPRFDEPTDQTPIQTPSDQDGPIQIKDKSEIPTKPAALVAGFEWSEMDLLDEVTMDELRNLLCNHYVEDKEEMFRFDYAAKTLEWALKAPGWRPEWHVGVRTSSSKKLVAFISAIPIKLRVRDKSFDSAEVNFICVHKKLRSKRLAPVLIMEITRRCNLEGIFQAIYTAGVLLPKPVSVCRYYHRSLNWEKLYSIGFAFLPQNTTRSRQVLKYKLPERTLTKGLRLMEAKDVPSVTKLLRSYLDRMKMVQVFDETEAAHWLLDAEHSNPRSLSRVVWTYVVETGGRVTDFFSFYRLNSTIIKKSGGEDTVKVAYLFYYGTEAAEQKDKTVLKARLNELMKDALILAKQAGFDVFNAVSVLDNSMFFDDQKFEPGDGRLHYYLYNYRTEDIANGLNEDGRADENNVGGIGVVML